MDILDQLINDTRNAMNFGQDTVTQVLRDALGDHQRFAAAIRSRPKPWFFVADETMTVFCTEGRPGNASAPHDHGAWSVLGCFEGSEESWWHEVDDVSGLRTVGSGVLHAGHAHSLPTDAIHAVMNRWDAPNGIIHIYQGNFLAAERHIWDPITGQRHTAGLAEPLAPTSDVHLRNDEVHHSTRPVLAGTAFAAITVRNLATATSWMAETFGLRSLTTDDDSCSTDQPYNYLIEPESMTIVGLHATSEQEAGAGLEHIAFRVSSIAELERWRVDLSNRGLNLSPVTAWKFGTFVDVIGPAGLTVRLFVPAFR